MPDADDRLSPPLITRRALVLGALTIAAVFYYLILKVGQGSGSGSYVRSQFPMVAFAPFVIWLFVNIGLKSVSPRLALRQSELLTIFSMLWIAGALPQWGWSDYWIAVVAAPAFMASPENQWSDLFLDLIPWQAMPATSPRVLESFWFGLPQGATLPWDAWLPVLVGWLGASVAMVMCGLCLVLLFQRHWVEAERLTFPLAQLPIELTRGVDGPRRTPDLFRSGLFWIGVGVVLVPLLYNICAYFSPGLPLLELYSKSYILALPKPLPHLIIRVLPLVLTTAYLCPMDILGSIVAFCLLAVVKIGAIDRVGFVIGGQGQPLSNNLILSLESFGAIVFIACWSVWLARGHLRRVGSLIRTGSGDRGEVRRYRFAVIGLLLSSLYVITWAHSLGATLPVAAGAFVLMMLTFFVTTKLIAATGFAYLMPSWPNAKGQIFIVELVGTSQLSEQDVVAFELFTSQAFFGNIRLPAWPAMPHLLRFFPFEAQPARVLWAVFLAFVVGFLVAAWASLEMAYDKGGATYLMEAFNVYDRITDLLHNPVSGEAGRWFLWLFGFGEATVLAVLRARFHWFPLHPIGVAFQYTSGTSIYWFSLFLVWGIKLTLLRYGGMRAYRAGKPLFFGLGIGYVLGVVLSGVVDVIWFPGAGHSVHNW
ncbi:MAG: hypothetical protein O2782_19050 [bacterium]|nr:hypothetical protein [bacterium]